MSDYDPYPMTASDVEDWEKRNRDEVARIISGRKEWQEYNERAKKGEMRMKDDLSQFLDEGGQFVIKKENDVMLGVIEGVIDGKKYHKGYTFKSQQGFIDGFNEIAGAALIALRKAKEKEE